MTRQHSNVIALALAESKPDEPTNNGPDSRKWDWPSRDALAQWEADVRKLACVCAVYNPRFDSTRFYDTCGYAGG